MDILPGFEDKFAKGKVCKLRKSLYGLKQSPRAWFERFTRVLRHDGYTQCQANHTLFVKHSTSDKITILIVYVDDIVLTRNCKEEMAHLKHLLVREFEIKDLGHLKYFLEMEVARSSKGIYVSQRKYTLDLLRETGMSGCKLVETPMDPNTKLGNIIQGEVVDRGRYQRLVGKLIYLTHTWPDISFVVSVVSQFLNIPLRSIWKLCIVSSDTLKMIQVRDSCSKRHLIGPLKFIQMLIGSVPLPTEGQLQGVVRKYGGI